MDQRLGVSKNGILDLPQLLCEKREGRRCHFCTATCSHSFFGIHFSFAFFGEDVRFLAKTERNEMKF